MAKHNKTIRQFKVDISQLKPDTNPDDYQQYKFKDLGYLVLYYRGSNSDLWNWHGFITPNDLQLRLGEKQYSKFCQGKRLFLF